MRLWRPGSSLNRPPYSKEPTTGRADRSTAIALFTTIVGIAGRVLFVQMRGDIDDVEDEVRRDLLSTSADLRAQLNMTLAEFETFHTGVQQAARKAAEQSTTAAQDAISNISRVANAAAENIDNPRGSRR